MPEKINIIKSKDANYVVYIGSGAGHFTNNKGWVREVLEKGKRYERRDGTFLGYDEAGTERWGLCLLGENGILVVVNYSDIQAIGESAIEAGIFDGNHSDLSYT